MLPEHRPMRPDLFVLGRVPLICDTYASPELVALIEREARHLLGEVGVARREAPPDAVPWVGNTIVVPPELSVHTGRRANPGSLGDDLCLIFIDPRGKQQVIAFTTSPAVAKEEHNRNIVATAEDIAGLVAW